MDNLKEVQEIQVAGLLHDFGKFIRKYNGGKGKHAILSGELLENNKELCLGCDIDTIVGLVASHHSDSASLFEKTVGVEIEPDKVVTATLADKVYSSVINVDKGKLKILTMADSLSASSDRRSETSEGTSGHSDYAPLWSPVAQVFGDRLAVKSGYDYKVYEYKGTDDTKATVLSDLNDSDFSKNMLNSFNKIKTEMSKLTDIDSLLALLEKCWTTVNANTWRPTGSTLGNTTTSLFDHSKTTSAIAGCLLVNKQNNVRVNLDSPNIDIWHLTCTGEHLSVRDTIRKELDRVGLSSACIIGNTDNEIYFMYPSSEAGNIIVNIKKLNAEIYKQYGETINFEIAKDWQFKNCDKSLSERYTTKFIGVLDVINSANTTVGNNDTSNNKNSTFGGYKVNHYDYILEQITENNDSISKLATTLRVFEMFSREVETYLVEHGCKVIESSFDKCVYTVKDSDVHKIESDINTIYKKYTSNCTGLTFSNVNGNRYIDGVNIINSELESFSKKRKLEDRGSYVKIRNKLFKIEAIEHYKNISRSASEVAKSTLFKVLKLYSDIIQYETDSNAEHLVSLSKFQYLISNEADENSKAFEKKSLQAVWDAEQNKIKPLATIYYEAILAESRRKR